MPQHVCTLFDMAALLQWYSEVPQRGFFSVIATNKYKELYSINFNFFYLNTRDFKVKIVCFSLSSFGLWHPRWSHSGLTSGHVLSLLARDPPTTVPTTVLPPRLPTRNTPPTPPHPPSFHIWIKVPAHCPQTLMQALALTTTDKVGCIIEISTTQHQSRMQNKHVDFILRANHWVSFE